MTPTAVYAVNKEIVRVSTAIMKESLSSAACEPIYSPWSETSAVPAWIWRDQVVDHSCAPST